MGDRCGGRSLLAGMMRRQDCLALVSALILLGVAPSSHAAKQSAADLDVLMEMSIDELNSMVVTARRRPELLQKVPLSVSRLDALQLREYQVDRLGDLQGLVPNLVAKEGDASNAVVYLRGIGQLDSLFFSDPGVGIYLDDVYLGCPQCANLNLFDLERVEVLRGPQGTLYGKNTIAGAIKYITKPLSEKSEAAAEFKLGNYQQQSVSGVLGGAIVDERLLGRFSFSSSAHDGFAKNSFTGQRSNDQSDLAWRGSLKWLARSDASFQLTLDGLKKTPSTSRAVLRETSVSDAAGNRFARSSDPLTIDANNNQRNKTDAFGISGTFNWDISKQLSLKSITAYRQLDYDSALDLDGTRQRILDVWYQLQQRQFSQEVKLNYAHEKINTVLGVYFYRDSSNAFDGVNMTDFYLAAQNFSGTASQYGQRTHSIAGYAEGTYQWTERLSLTGGLRYTAEKKEFERNYQVFSLGDLPQPGSGIAFHSGTAPGGTGPYTMKKSWASFSPKLGAGYEWNENLLTYASASSGFKSGGFDGRAKALPGALNQPYNPENVVSYELGLKISPLNHRLMINAALFFNNYRDVQLSTFAAGSPQPVFINAGKGVTKGFELDFSAKPGIKGLTVRGAIGYLHSDYKEFLGQNGSNIADQRRFANAPTWTLMLGAVHAQSLNGQGLFKIGGDVRSLRSVYPTVSSSETVAQRNTTTLNAFVNYETQDKHWLFTLAGKNLLNTKYREYGFDFSNSLGYQVAYYGDPRTVNVSAAYKF